MKTWNELVIARTEAICANLELQIRGFPEDLLQWTPSSDERSFHAIALHLIRCLEVYTTHIMEGRVQAAPYRPPHYATRGELLALLQKVKQESLDRVRRFPKEYLEEEIRVADVSATRFEYLIEMVDHTCHHIGQLQLYWRMNKLTPPTMKWLA
jgi:uncharacterized damage-inducible protein DinB